MKLGHTYKPHNGYRDSERWLLDDYAPTLVYDKEKGKYKYDIILHFSRNGADDGYDKIWETVKECYECLFEDVTEKVVHVKPGKYNPPRHFYCRNVDYRGDDIVKELLMVDFDYGCNISRDDHKKLKRYLYFSYKKGTYSPSDGLYELNSKWDGIRLAADNSCWCADLGIESPRFSLRGNFIGKFNKVREVKERFLGVKSLREFKPLFDRLPEYKLSPYTPEKDISIRY